MPDHSSDPPGWHRDNKGRIKDTFGKEPEPERPEENKEPRVPGKPPKLEHHPRRGLWYQDNSGKPMHTKDEIEKWADHRRRKLKERHDGLIVNTRARHDLRITKILQKYKERVTGKDTELLKNVSVEHTSELAELQKKIAKERRDHETQVAASYKAGRILDGKYLDEHNLDLKHSRRQIDDWAQHARNRLDDRMQEEWNELHDRHDATPDLDPAAAQTEISGLEQSHKNVTASLDQLIATTYRRERIPDTDYLHEHGIEAGHATGRGDEGRDR
jgi:hypothetical protein